MTDQEEENEIDYGDDEGESNAFFRWLQALVVLFAFGGFFGLAWYAYKSGDSMDDKDVELIKVEKTPVKEAPENPGGMQIPNQDKTVYSLIDNNAKTDKPVVERIMPATEEPVNPDNGSQVWMNEKLKGKDSGSATEDDAPVVKEVPAKQKDAEQFNPGKNRPEKNEEVKMAQAAPSSNVAPAEAPQLQEAKEAPAPTPAPAAPVVKQQQPKAQDNSTREQAEEKTEEKMEAKAPAPAATGKLPKVRVQLAALGSEDEAERQWQRLARKFPDDLGTKQHYIVHVTVNGKIYYRLQAAPFDSPKDAQSLCANLTGSGQACILAKSK